MDRGCMYCGNLISKDETLTDFKCKVAPELNIENAGACFIVGSTIIRDCSQFVKGDMIKDYTG